MVDRCAGRRLEGLVIEIGLWLTLRPSTSTIANILHVPSPTVNRPWAAYDDHIAYGIRRPTANSDTHHIVSPKAVNAFLQFSHHASISSVGWSDSESWHSWNDLPKGTAPCAKSASY